MYFPRLTFSFGATDTAKTQYLSQEGSKGESGILNWEVETFDAIVRLANFATAATATIALVNQDGLTIYSIAGVAKNQLTTPAYLQFSRKIKKGSYITVTLNDVAGAGGGDVTIDLGYK
jgi:hypothetical protein